MKPPPISRVSFTRDDIVTAEDTTPEHAKACQELYDKFGGLYNAGPFTPLPYHAKGAQTQAGIIFPGATGGANWGNPEGLVPYIRTSPPGIGFFNARVPEGNWPCFKPPWGRLIAVNANTGDFAWQVPLGVTDNLPEGKRNTGAQNTAGPIATAGGLVFIGSTNDNRFRAFDSRNGKELWTYKLDYTATAIPITYQGKNGKQYVAIVAAAGGTGRGATTEKGLFVFALP